MSGYLDRERARACMERAGLDGLVICAPENFYYASGFSSMLLDLYRQAPLGLVVLPRDAQVEPVVIVPEAEVAAVKAATGLSAVYGFPIWWEVYPLPGWEPSLPGTLAEMRNPPPRALPEQYDVAGIFALLKTALSQLGLERGRLGIEMDFISARVFAALQGVLPEPCFIDSTALLYELRRVKCAGEIEALKTACAVTEAGLVASARAVRGGVSIPELTFAFQTGVLETIRERALQDALGPIEGQPDLGTWGAPDRAHPGVRANSTIKYDMQVSLRRYHSDVGRTIVFGEPAPEQQAVVAALMEAHARMQAALVPGRTLGDVYQAARDAIARGGFPRHSRGHFGHSVGLDPKIEEPPFISAGNPLVLEPGMVLAFETPFYFQGIGKFQFENMAVITPDGPLILNQLPMDWRRWL